MDYRFLFPEIGRSAILEEKAFLGVVGLFCSCLFRQRVYNVSTVGSIKMSEVIQLTLWNFYKYNTAEFQTEQWRFVCVFGFKNWSLPALTF